MPPARRAPLSEPAGVAPGAAATVIQLARNVPRMHLAALGLLMLLASLTEGIGLMLLVPLIGLVGDSITPDGRFAAISTSLQAAGLPVTVEGLLLAFVGLVALRSVIQFLREQVGVRIERSLVDTMRTRAYAALLQAEWRWLAHSTRSDHAHVLLSNIDRLGTGVTYAMSLSAGMATMLAYGLVALWLAPLMTVVVTLTGAAVFALLAAQRRRALVLGRQLSTSRRAMFATVDQGLGAIKLTKILANEQRHLGRFETSITDLRQQSLAYSASLSRSRALFQLGAATLLAVYLYLGLTLWQVPVPELVTLIVLFARAVPMLMGMQQNLFVLLHAVPAIEEVERLLSETGQAAEAAPDDNGRQWLLAQELRLDQVSVIWPDRDRAALDRVSLIVPARTTLAVIGPSGSGKSTLADVIMGLLVPDHGTVLVDGQPIRLSDRAAWRRAVAYVPQDVILFNDTIRANLAWGLSPDAAHQADANDAAMRAALEQAGAEFVFDLPDGLDTRVGDDGQRLSGGERQRIALARALLRRPALLILDEATSALDVDNERRIRDAIERLHGDLTMIVIGHRLPTLENADQVIRLDQGRVAAQGTWAQVGGLSAAEPG